MAAVSLRWRPEHLLRLAVYGTCVLTHAHERNSEQQNGREVFASKGQLLLLSLPCPLPERLEKRGRDSCFALYKEAVVPARPIPWQQG